MSPYDRIMNDKLDYLFPFHLESCPVRGRMVRLSALTADLAAQHRYPQAIQDKLNHLVALGLILASGFKFEGIFTLQVTGDGPVRLMLVDITHEGHVRACARFDPTHTFESTASLDSLFGRAVLAFTVDQPTTIERYQGIIELKGETFAQCVQCYFEQSEQIKTHLTLFSDHTDVGAVFIQRMPPQHQNESWDENLWQDLGIFMTTLTPHELLDESISPPTLLHRLFWNEGLVLDPEKSIALKCRCSHEKIKAMLSGFDPNSRQEMVKDGRITVTCEFCNQEYHFEPF